LYTGLSTGGAGVLGGRVYMPGRALVQIIIFPAFLCALTGDNTKFRRASALVAAFLGLTIILIFTRAVWVSTIVTLGILPFVARPAQIQRYFVLIRNAGLAIILVVSVVQLSGIVLSSGFVTVAQNRFLSIILNNFEDQNVQSRIVEDNLVLRRVSDNWVTGAGFHTSLGVRSVYDQAAAGPRFIDVYAGHNGYLGLLLDAGILGLGSFSLFIISLLRKIPEIRSRKVEDPYKWAVTLGLWLAMVRLLINGATEANFDDSFTVPLIAICFALLDVRTCKNRGIDSILLFTGRATMPQPIDSSITLGPG
jgi:O-antigen ligase